MLLLNLMVCNNIDMVGDPVYLVGEDVAMMLRIGFEVGHGGLNWVVRGNTRPSRLKKQRKTIK
jgi:hypothetical protein